MEVKVLLWLAVSALVALSAKGSQYPPHVKRACETFTNEGFEAFAATFAEPKCRDALLPNLEAFSDINNRTANEIASNLLCSIRECQSLIDLEILCLGLEFTTRVVNFYCGKNNDGVLCYEAFHSNNGSQVIDACSGEQDVSCKESCQASINQLFDEVGCCLNTPGYLFLNTSSFDSCHTRQSNDICKSNFEIDHELPNACRAFETNFADALQYVNQDCRDSVLPAVSAFENIRDFENDKVASDAACISQCRSLINLELVCLGREVVDYGAAYYCGVNEKEQKCYEAFQVNDGSRVAEECNTICTDSCKTELEKLVNDVGCCVRSTGYNGLFEMNWFEKCGLHVPGFCPHLFQDSCQTFDTLVMSSDDSCRSRVEPVLTLGGILNNQTASQMFADQICVSDCRSLVEESQFCFGKEQVDGNIAHYCGMNEEGKKCYEEFSANDGSRVAEICTRTTSCTDSCKAELENLVNDVGCCVQSIGYSGLLHWFEECGLQVPSFCPHLFQDSCQSFDTLVRASDDKCRSRVEPVVTLAGISNNQTTTQMFANQLCVSDCRSLVEDSRFCFGEEQVDGFVAYYCGMNEEGKKCYEEYLPNDANKVIEACTGDGCSDSCRTELQELVDDVGCCVRSAVYGFLTTELFTECNTQRPSFCPHVFNGELTETAPPDSGTADSNAVFSFLAFTVTLCTIITLM